METMRIILLILLLVFSCNDSDDLFFVLNPNKKSIISKEKKECIRNTLALYAAGLNNPKYFIDGSCDDPTSSSRRQNPDINQCKERALMDFQTFIIAQIVSCPKGLAEE